MTKRGMLLLWAAVCSAILVSGVFSPAQASLLFQAELTGASEVPPVASPATGFVTVLLNDAETGVTINLTFSGLLAPQSAAHIHCCTPAGANAAVRIAPPTLPLGNLVDLFVLIPDPLPGPALSRAGFVQGLKDELAYFNVHSTQFPGGEIRGQLQAVVPAPTTLLLLGSGLVAVAAAIRRRRRS